MMILNIHLLSLLIIASIACAGEQAFMQTSDGLVVFEGEHFHANTKQKAHAWEVKSDIKASDGKIVITTPADHVQRNNTDEIIAQSPRLDYTVVFLMPGRHYVWVKAQGSFVHVGLNGVPGGNAQRIGGFSDKALGWRNQCRATYGQPAFIDVPSAGEHTIHLWMQEAGTAVDHIILTPRADYRPDKNISESPRGRLPPQSPWVSAGPDHELNPPNATLKLSGEARDYDGKVIGYAWSQVDGPTPVSFLPPNSVATLASQFTHLGIYHLRLTVTDDSGLSASRDVTVRVTPAVAPTVHLHAVVILFSDTAVDLTPSAQDADSDVKLHPLVFDWQQVSGPSQAALVVRNKSQASLSKLVEGTYVFSVRVTDFTGNATTVETRVVKRPVPQGTTIDADDPSIQYVGRFYTVKPKIRESGWPATAICARFTGTSIRARLALTGWGGASSFYAIIDGKEDAPVILGGDNRTDWLVVEGLPDGEHSIELVRLGGAWNASSVFSGFHLDAGKSLAEPPACFARRIEFYGDSITEGGMMPGQPFTNGYLAYAATTARLLKAEPSVVCKSGIGLVKGFTLPQTLPGMYNRIEPMRGDQLWDFSAWTPHVVVVNIGQNDSWTGANHTTFVDSYVAFVTTLRGHYPKAFIVCALGSMDAVAPNSPWPSLVRQAVDRLNDSRVETFYFDYLGAKGHPSSLQAHTMAEKLAAYLEAKGADLWESAR